ncbi:MAG: 23S rRNA (uracil(1939)-C(5))-methyltransferase RlmD [Tissierellia bacterium]|nr:23S rRNA (uracil(1939)-C(5))-methyltransferase RlmD [Tissierellia bacterium]
MTRKKIVDLKIEKMKYPNKSIGYYNDKEVEFKGGILGQTAKVKFTKNSKTKKKAKFIEIVESSSIENAKNYCPNADICGGCSYQKVPYETELLLKREMIIDLLEEEKIEYKKVSINRSPRLKGYRNKMEYTFGDKEKGGILQLGLHRKNRFYEIVDTEGCNIVDEDFEKIRKFVLLYFRRNNASFYHKNTHEGFLRNLIVKKAHNTGEIMINLVTTTNDAFDDIKKKIFANTVSGADVEGKIVSVYHTTNDSWADAVVAEKVELIFGKDHITEELMGLKFKIGPFSFFQPNVFSASKLYQKAMDFANCKKTERVLDLYSGTGTITQLMSKDAYHSTGVEIVEEAVEKARENAKINEIENIDFICGDVLKKVDILKGKYEVIVLDPPREGINPNAIEKIIDMKPSRFVYISCNPKTQVRDIKIFEENGYNLEEYEIFDQFPNTRHVECIALLRRVKG